VEFRKAQEITTYKQKLRQEIQEMIGQEASNEDMIDKCQQHVVASNNALGDVDITILVSTKWPVSAAAMKHFYAMDALIY
jgi:hypothetical protein